MTTMTMGARLAAVSGLALGFLSADPALATVYWLQAETTTLTMPGGATVPMWAFARCAADFTSCDPASVPGPKLVVPPGEPLTVHLRNLLTVPVSIVIPGQVTAMTPVWDSGATGARPSPTARVRSFTHETAPGATAAYTWPTLKDGTYVYHSGTHPQVQVQMGLYGAMTRNYAAGSAYPGVAFDRELTLVYSEIDPDLHAAVGGPNPTYGTAAGPTSTLNYQPRYFLINGKPHSVGDPAIDTVSAGKTTLLRFVNAGLTTRVPVIDDPYLRMIAEDGNPYPWGANPRQRYSVFLPAAKTMDATIRPSLAGPARIAIYDRTLALTNNTAPGGGMLAFLDVSLVPDPQAQPPAFTSAPVTSATYGLPYAYTAAANDPEGGPVTYALDVAPAGMAINAATGAIAWTPQKSQVGSASVTVRATDPTTLSATQSFTITVANANYAPTASGETYAMVQGGTLNVAAPGVLANDSDPDGDVLSAVLGTPPANGTFSLAPNGGFTYTPPADAAGTTRTFTYSARDALANTSGPVTVTITIAANKAPVAVDDTFAAPRFANTAPSYTPVVLPVLANDSDPDTAIDPANAINPATVTIVAAPNKGGTATVNADGTVSYTPKRNFRGTENFSYRVRDTRNLQSARATVRVNVQ